jgi:hypothetical protein
MATRGKNGTAFSYGPCRPHSVRQFIPIEPATDTETRFKYHIKNVDVFFDGRIEVSI